jgi:hypothetical protein
MTAIHRTIAIHAWTAGLGWLAARKYGV